MTQDFCKHTPTRALRRSAQSIEIEFVQKPSTKLTQFYVPTWAFWSQFIFCMQIAISPWSILLPTFLVWIVLLVDGQVCNSMFGGDPAGAARTFMRVWRQSSDGNQKEICLLQITRYHFETWCASECWQYS